MKRQIKRQKLAFFLLLGLVLILGVLFAWRPFLDETLKKLFITEASRRLNAKVAVGDLHISLIPLKLSLSEIEVKPREGPVQFIGVKSVSIWPGSGPIIGRRVVLNRVEIDEPSLLIDLAQFKSEPSRKFPTWLKIPTLRDIIRIQLDEAQVTNAKLSLLLPGGDVRLNVKSGNAEFRGKGEKERWTWKGEGELVRKERTLPLDLVNIEAERDGDNVIVDHFDVQLLNSRFALSGQAYPNVDLKYEMTSELKPVGDALEQLGFSEKPLHLKGNFHADGNVRGSWNDYKTTNHIRFESFELLDRKLPSMDLSVRTVREQIQTMSASIDLGGSKVEANFAEVRVGKSLAFDVKSARLNLKKLLEVIEPQHIPKTFADAEVRVVGRLSLKPFDVTGYYSIRAPSLDLQLPPEIQPYLPLQFRDISTEGKIVWLKDRQALAIEEGKIKAEEIQASYRFEFQKEGQVSGVWSAHIENVSGAFEKNFPVHGEGSVTGKLEADHKGHETELNIKLDDLGYEEYPPQPFSGIIQFHAEHTELKKFSLGEGPTLLKLDGDFSSEKGKMQLDASWKNFDLGWIARVAGRVYPYIGKVNGVGKGSLQLTEEASQLNGAISLSSDQIAWNDHKFGRLNVALDVENSKYNFRQAQLEGGSAKAEVRGVVSKNEFQDFEIETHLFPLSVAPLPSWIYRFFDHASGKIKFTGPMADPNVDGEVGFYQREESGNWAKRGTTFLQQKLSDLILTLDFENGQLLGKARANLKDRSSYSAEGKFKGFSLRPLIPQADSVLNGGFNVTGHFKDPDKLEGVLQFDEAKIVRGEWHMEMGSPISVKIHQGGIEVPRVTFKGPSTDAAVTASFKSGGRDLLAQLDGHISLQLLSLFLKPINRAEGETKLSVQVGGTTSSPRLTGHVSLDNGLVQFRNFPHTLEDISLEMSLDQQRMSVDRVSATLGGGKIQAQGQIGLGASVPETNILLRGSVEKIQFRFPNWLPSTFSGNLLLSGPLSRPLLRGDLKVHEAVYTDTWDWKSKLLTFGRSGSFERISRAEEEHIRFDLNFTSEGDRFYIRNNIANGKMKGKLRLTGSDQALGLLGRVEIREGEVDFLENTFEILSGFVTFDSDRSIKPTFDITAKTQVKQTDIYLDIRTQGEGVMAFLSSQPPKDETNIVALLTLGVDTDELEQSGASGGSNLSTSVLPGVLSAPIQSKLESGLRKAKLVDTFQFVPFFSETTKSTGLKMIASKQFLPKVRLSYSTDLLNISGENTVKLEHDLSEHFSVFESFRDNPPTAPEELDLGVDLEFRLDF